MDNFPSQKISELDINILMSTNKQIQFGKLTAIKFCKSNRFEDGKKGVVLSQKIYSLPSMDTGERRAILSCSIIETQESIQEKIDSRKLRLIMKLDSTPIQNKEDEWALDKGIINREILIKEQIVPLIWDHQILYDGSGQAKPLLDIYGRRQYMRYVLHDNKSKDIDKRKFPDLRNGTNNKTATIHYHNEPRIAIGRIKLPIEYVVHYGYSNAWHLAYYVPKNSGESDERVYSDEMLNFKDGNRESIIKWSLWAASELQKLNIHFDYVIRALNSDEIMATDQSGLDVLGSHLEMRFGWKYCPSVLKKTRHGKPMKGMKKAQRQENVDGLYIIGNSSVDFNGKNILILDDITTTGTTAAAINNTLKKKWPNGVYYFFALAKTNGRPNANNSISENFIDELPELPF